MELCTFPLDTDRCLQPLVLYRPASARLGRLTAGCDGTKWQILPFGQLDVMQRSNRIWLQGEAFDSSRPHDL